MRRTGGHNFSRPGPAFSMMGAYHFSKELSHHPARPKDGVDVQLPLLADHKSSRGSLHSGQANSGRNNLLLTEVIFPGPPPDSESFEKDKKVLDKAGPSCYMVLLI